MLSLRVPAAVIALALALPARGDAQTFARPVPFVSASTAWGVVIRHFFESDFGRAAQLPPTLAALRPLDLVLAGPRLLAGPIAHALAAGMTPGAFAGFPAEQRLALLHTAAEMAGREAQARVDVALAEGLPETDLEGAISLVDQVAGPLELYVSKEVSDKAAKAAPALRRRLEASRAERLLAAGARTAEALAKPAEPAAVEPPHMLARNARDADDAARLARTFAAGLSRSGSSDVKRGYVSGLWELADVHPSRESHSVAARALIRELGNRRKKGQRYRLLVLQAMRALGNRTPYEEVERRIVRAALEESSRALQKKIERESDITADSIAQMSPFPSVRKLAAKRYRDILEWTGDEDSRRDLEGRLSRLEAPIRPDYWPSWKPPRPPTLAQRALAALRKLLR